MMNVDRLKELAGVPQKAGHGNMDLFQDSLKIVFGLSPDLIETIVALVRRHGDTALIRDQQVRRRAGGRAVQLLKQAHAASASEGDERYDSEDSVEEVDPTDEQNPKDEV